MCFASYLFKLASTRLLKIRENKTYFLNWVPSSVRRRRYGQVYFQVVSNQLGICVGDDQKPGRGRPSGPVHFRKKTKAGLPIGAGYRWILTYITVTTFPGNMRIDSHGLRVVSCRHPQTAQNTHSVSCEAVWSSFP